MALNRICDFGPEPGNPRNSEGGFIRLKNGAVLLAYSRFSGGGEDDAAADIYGVEIRGSAVSAPRLLIAAREEKAQNLMSVSLLRMMNGDIGLFYLRRAGDTVLQMFVRRSADEGSTWSAPVCATPREGFFVINNDRVTRLSDGRIMIPAAEHIKQRREDGSVYFEPRAEAVFFVSTDDGASFEQIPGRCVMPALAHCQSGLQEPGVLELKNGALFAYARTDLGRQYQMLSPDGGRTWTAAEPSQFTSPLSPLCLKRLSDGRLTAIYNPVPLYDGRSATSGGCWTGGRTPLCLRVSKDDGASFSPPMYLETQGDSGYCYTAAIEDEGSLLMAYCAGGGADGSCLSRLRVARLPLSDIEGE